MGKARGSIIRPALLGQADALRSRREPEPCPSASGPRSTRRGPRKAILAVAASMLTAASFMLRNGVEYHDLGPDHCDRTDTSMTVKRLVRKLTELGREVETKNAAETAVGAVFF